MEKVFLGEKCNKQFRHGQNKFKHEQRCGNEKNRLKCDGCGYKTDKNSLLCHKRK